MISLISDAGTPGLSDPGAILVKECVKEDINIIPIPGSSAITAALSISGFSEKFFLWFFSRQKKDFLKDLQILSEVNCSIIFFISSKKLISLFLILKKNLLEEKF